MPSPQEGSIFTKGQLQPLTFITAFNANGASLSATLHYITVGNNVSFNNAQVTVVDAPTGVLQITPSLNYSGNCAIQFKKVGANNSSIEYSPIFEFKVEDPIV